MKKLPVAETVRFAYRFAFGQLGTIIGLSWAPTVGIAVLWFLPHMLGDTGISPERDPAAAGAAALRGIVFTLASLLLYAVINAAVIRQALGLRRGSAVFHLSFGREEFRLMGVSLLLLIVLSLLSAACGYASIAARSMAAEQSGPAAGNLAAALVSLAGLCLLLFVMVRLGFLYVPAAVAEGKTGLERSWTLTRGNFWRASLAIFVATLPLVVAVSAAFLALTGRDFATLTPVAGQLSPLELSARIDAILDRHTAGVIGIFLISAPFSFGLALGASAAGYRALAETSRPSGAAGA